VWEELRAIRVCGERKKISDLVQCITITGRHLKQVQDAREAGFEFIFLVTEGLYRPGENGELEVREGNRWVPYYPAIEYYRVDSYLNELQWYMGVVVKRSSSPRETARLVLDMYRLFQEPPEQHDSLKRFYSIPAPMRYRDWKKKPSLLRRVAKEFKLVGWERSEAIDQSFSSVAEFVNADRERLERVEGIGKGIAESIWSEARRGA